MLLQVADVELASPRHNIICGITVRKDHIRRQIILTATRYHLNKVCEIARGAVSDLSTSRDRTINRRVPSLSTHAVPVDTSVEPVALLITEVMFYCSLPAPTVSSLAVFLHT